MSQLRKWDDQGCLPWLVKCSCTQEVKTTPACFNALKSLNRPTLSCHYAFSVWTERPAQPQVTLAPSLNGGSGVKPQMVLPPPEAGWDCGNA